MSNHHGSLLKRYLRVNDIDVPDLAKRMGIKSRGTLYNWMKKAVLNAVQLIELKKHGIDLGVELPFNTESSQGEAASNLKTHNEAEKR